MKGEQRGLVSRAQKDAERRARYRLELYVHYGGECKCCGENTLEFLCFDHIGGGGNKERQRLNSDSLLRKLYRERPTNIRLLCWNCNGAIGLRGFCPHEGIPSRSMGWIRYKWLAQYGGVHVGNHRVQPPSGPVQVRSKG